MDKKSNQGNVSPGKRKRKRPEPHVDPFTLLRLRPVDNSDFQILDVSHLSDKDIRDKVELIRTGGSYSECILLRAHAQTSWQW